MSAQQAPERCEGGGAAASQSWAQPAHRPTETSPETLQYLLDQAAYFHMIVSPGAHGPAVVSPAGGGEVAGFSASETLHYFDVELELPPPGGCVRARNVVGASAGRVDLRWVFIPPDFMARPDSAPPLTRLDASRSQRFIMQEATFTFGDGRDGFRVFGTGRTFPFAVAGRPKLVVAAVGDITSGFGKFAGRVGTLTFCGDLVPGRGFVGHVVARVADEDGALRARTLPSPASGGTEQEPESDVTYLIWTAHKGRGEDQENSFSVGPDGQVRGLNIPTQLRRMQVGFSARGTEGFQSLDLHAGEVIGRETGFGRGSVPEAPPTGTPLSPFQFEGVAQYSLLDSEGGRAGAITTNVLEGRRFDMRLERAPEQPGLRFGFFGPVVYGAGCFAGAEGMFYGSSASIFNLPPGSHVITHFYAARIHDPDGRFRAAAR